MSSLTYAEAVEAGGDRCLAILASGENPDGTPALGEDAASWSQTVTADNAAATATKAGVAGKTHYVTSLHAGFSAAAVGKQLVLKDGADVIGTFFVHDQRDIVFPRPIAITAGNDVSAVLDASGTAGQIGAVVLTGFTA